MPLYSKKMIKMKKLSEIIALYESKVKEPAVIDRLAGEKETDQEKEQHNEISKQ